MKQVFDETLDGHFKLASGWNEAVDHLKDCEWGEGVHEDYPFEPGEKIRIHVERHPLNTKLTSDIPHSLDNLSLLGIGAIGAAFEGKAVPIGHTLLSEYINTIKAQPNLESSGANVLRFTKDTQDWIALSSVIDVNGEYLLNILFCITIDNMASDLKNDLVSGLNEPNILN